RAKQQKQDLTKQVEALQEKLKKTTDKTAKAAIEKQLGDLEVGAKSMEELVDRLQETMKKNGPALYKEGWLENQAYVSDAYRLIANRQMCLQCHEVAGTRSSNPTTQGPPLAKVHERLRPDWVLRWIATPQRHLPYE